MPQTKEEMLLKKRALEKKRYERIKNNPVLYAAYKQRNKQKYERRKRDGKVVNISQLTEREKLEQRQKWRESARKSYERRKRARDSTRVDEMVNERMDSPVSRRTRSFYAREPRSIRPEDSIDDSHTYNPAIPGTSGGITHRNRPSICNSSSPAPSSHNSSDDGANYGEHPETSVSTPVTPTFRPSSPAPSSANVSDGADYRGNTDTPVTAALSRASLAMSTDNAVDSFEIQGTSMNVMIRSRDNSPPATTSSIMLTADRSTRGTAVHEALAQRLGTPLPESTIQNEIALIKYHMRLMSMLLILVYILNILSNWILIWYILK